MAEDLPRWIISRIRGKRADYVTTVSAKDAETAISTVVSDFRITNPEDVKRLAARPAAR
jgi:hypothetical protein